MNHRLGAPMDNRHRPGPLRGGSAGAPGIQHRRPANARAELDRGEPAAPARRKRTLLSALVASLVALALSGCAGYKLGPTNSLAAGQKSIQVQPFANQTLEPRLTDAVALEMRKSLQRDGTFRLETRADGDIVVSGVIIRYDRRELSFVPNDVLTVRDYRVTLTAQVTARERATGKVLLDRPVTGYTLLRVGADLTSAERQALPLLAADLARNVTTLLADGAW